MENSKDLGKKKIKEEDLGTISGGCGKKIDPKKDDHFHSRMRCRNCDNREIWTGDWRPNYAKYICPDCKQKEMYCRQVLRRY